jgi:hypothetical protein
MHSGKHLESNPPDTRNFSVLLSPTPRGARLARLLATEQLRTWGLPFETTAQVVAEPSSKTALHGHMPGRDFSAYRTIRRRQSSAPPPPRTGELVPEASPDLACRS